MIDALKRTVLIAAFAAACTAGDGRTYGTAILNGRVIDPDTRLDAVRNVGILDGRIATVTEGPISGRDTIDATGLVVAPGFIDLHAHGQDSVSRRLQALDGVTTALEMERTTAPRWVTRARG
jgi:N-acyl-D-aspartate/D-glutamate deacylase